MDNPVLVEVTRGGHVESCHRGAFIVMDADGAIVMSAGDINRPVFPRSAVKAIQALPLVESGAADAFGFGARELSFACSSHNGEEGHVSLARDMLARAGLDGDALECGPHWSYHPPVARAQARAFDQPGRVHNNCSGKHSGFLCACSHLEIDHAGYVKREHRYQAIIAETMTEVTGAAHGAGNAGIDGCSIPTYAVPLSAMAHGFARMATGQGLGPERAKAAKRLLNACMDEPWYMAGTDRACTAIMERGAGRLFAKTGAEGVFCAAIPELGCGIAVKCDDGATRGSEAIVTALFARLLPKGDPLAQAMQRMSSVTVTNWTGDNVGVVRPAGPLAQGQDPGPVRLQDGEV